MNAKVVKLFSVKFVVKNLDQIRIRIHMDMKNFD